VRFSKPMTATDVAGFAQGSGDTNPLHLETRGGDRRADSLRRPHRPRDARRRNDQRRAGAAPGSGDPSLWIRNSSRPSRSARPSPPTVRPSRSSTTAATACARPSRLTTAPSSTARPSSSSPRLPARTPRPRRDRSGATPAPDRFVPDCFAPEWPEFDRLHAALRSGYRRLLGRASPTAAGALLAVASGG
jgi:hypothetical protein